jgi:hypothetical protein
MSTFFPMEQQDSIEYVYIAAEDAVLRAHSWDVQLVFKATLGVGVKSKNPSIFDLPTMTDQDIFQPGSNTILK